VLGPRPLLARRARPRLPQPLERLPPHTALRGL